jgi:hypothetical protein
LSRNKAGHDRPSSEGPDAVDASHRGPVKSGEALHETTTSLARSRGSPEQLPAD